MALARALRALLLASEAPLHVDALLDLFNGAADEEEWPAPVARAEVEAALATLQAQWDGRDGLTLVAVAGGYRLRTAEDLSPLLRRLWPERTPRLSKAALEALAVIAYRQPCTRLDVEDVRGVDCGGVLRSLLDRKLVRIVGKREEPGRPLLYGTTPEFLELFTLPDLQALPTLRDLESMRAEEIAREATQPGVADGPAAVRSAPRDRPEDAPEDFEDLTGDLLDDPPEDPPEVPPGDPGEDPLDD